MTATETASALSSDPPSALTGALPSAPPASRASSAKSVTGSSATSGATWTSERIDRLKACMNAGLTCSQIARELGISRNAVIGKLNRLGLARGRAPARRPERVSTPRMRQPNIITQRQLLRAVYAEATPVAAEAPSVVSLGRCSLLELTHATCRWPISEADAADVFFCGNSAVAGLPYCAGHVRMAYRVPARRHA